MPSLKEVAPRVRIGRGFTRNNLTIFPLFAESEIMPSEYVPVGAAIRSGIGKVTEFSEAGSVPKLAIDNQGILPILILDGEELIGARQNRIASLTVLAPAKATIPIPVACVERGRWGYRSGVSSRAHEFTESSQVLHHTARARKARDISESLFKHGARMVNQMAVWNDIDAVSMKMGSISPTQAMADVYNDQKANIDEYLADVKAADGQIGAVFAINGCPAGLEIFDSPETLKTYLPKILRSYALEALSNRVKHPRPATDAEASKLVDSILDLETKSFPAVGLGEDLRIESKDITGGALTYEGKVVHLAAFNTELPR